jgi:hypothetical protein
MFGYRPAPPRRSGAGIATIIDRLIYDDRQALTGGFRAHTVELTQL